MVCHAKFITFVANFSENFYKKIRYFAEVLVFQL
jgi:hypothetical protein